MAHFAQIVGDTVVSVIVIGNDDIDNLPYPQSEARGQQFIRALGFEGDWLQTSYNNNFRTRYAGIGYVYDPVRDAFIPPRPYMSWQFNTQSLDWDPPVPYPQTGQLYAWNENSVNWELV